MAASKIRVLAFSSYYKPGFKAGGPIVSVGNLVAQLSSDFDFRIATRSHDFGEHAPLPGINPGTWNEVGPVNVFYLSRAHELGAIAAIMRDTPHDLVYLNSFFDPCLTLMPLIAQRLALAPPKPVLIAPRGEFSPGALRLKQLKKSAFITLARATEIFANVTWHASTELEASDIHRAMRVAPSRVAVAPNLPRIVSQPLQLATYRDTKQPLRVAFLSRVSAKKNLLFALKVLAEVQAPVVFSIYGPKEDGQYWRRCETLMAALPAHVRADYRGVVTPEMVIETLGQHDLLFLPTLGENYGHVIAESLLAGTPVLISDQTPWRNLREKGLGADFPLGEPELFSRWLDNFATLPAEEFLQLRNRCIAHADGFSNDEAAINANRAMFHAALAHG